jgi:deoxyribodipyrimidine photo-lyase
MLDWRHGERWFWDTLLDADLANNSASWQWIAGCGADAAPYFRIFNPIIQGEKFDPNGDYVREYIPELSQIPTKFIHKPWEAPEDILLQAGIILDKDYPLPIVDLKLSRERALSAFKGLSENN